MGAMGSSVPSSAGVAAARRAETPRVFWSGHLTAGHADRRQAWLPIPEEKAEIRASLPPFNNANKLEIPAGVEKINVPAFGPNIANAVMRMFASEQVRGTAGRLNLPLATCALSKFVQDKMPKVRDMVGYCKSNQDIARSNAAAIGRLESFLTEFQGLGPTTITSVAQWEAFVDKYAAPGWQSKLHFDYLLGVFGFEKQASDTLRKIIFKKPDGEAVTFEQHSFRWLSKALAAYGPVGAMTDVVNLVFAMTGDSYENLSDVDIAKKIDALCDKIHAGSVSNLWVPTHFFMDAEIDDCLAWILLEHVYQVQATGSCWSFLRKGRAPRLNVLVQLPPGAEFDDLETRWRHMPSCEVWRDPNARNEKAVRTLHLAK